MITLSKRKRVKLPSHENVSEQLMMGLGPTLQVRMDRFRGSDIYVKSVALLEERLLHYATLLETSLRNNREIIGLKKTREKLAAMAKEAGKPMEEMSLTSDRMPRIKVPHVEKMLDLLSDKTPAALAKNCEELFDLSGGIIADGKKEGWISQHGQFVAIKDNAEVVQKLSGLHLMLLACDLENIGKYAGTMKKDGTAASRIVLNDARIKDLINNKLPVLFVFRDIFSI